MHQIQEWTAFFAGVSVAVALVVPGRAHAAPRPPIAPTETAGRPITTEVDPDAGMTFSLYRDQEALVVRGRAGDVYFEKSNRPDGTVSFTLADAADRVAVRIDRQALVVTRTGTEVRVSFRQASASSELRAMQRLLADSSAIAAVDRLVSRLGARQARMSLVESLRQVHLWTRYLGGHPLPARTLVAGLSAPGYRLVTASAGGMSCWRSYEGEVWDAYTQYAGCYEGSLSAEYGNYIRDACGLLYYLRAESAWFELLSCIAIPFR